MIYDTDLNITWLRDASLATSNTFGVAGIQAGGYMDWNTAQSWVGAMNSADYLGYNDWRLPATPVYCIFWNCTNSEMGHLYYDELGGVAGNPLSIYGNSNLHLFNGLQIGTFSSYWSGTISTPSLEPTAWSFVFASGGQSISYQRAAFFALPVRTGDIATVPVPGAGWLFSSGLLGLVGAAKKRIGKTG